MQNDEARHRKIELADLINEPWCLPSLESFRWYLVADTFRARGLDPPPYPVGITTLKNRNIKPGGTTLDQPRTRGCKTVRKGQIARRHYAL